MNSPVLIKFEGVLLNDPQAFSGSVTVRIDDGRLLPAILAAFVIDVLDKTPEPDAMKAEFAALMVAHHASKILQGSVPSGGETLQ